MELMTAQEARQNMDAKFYKGQDVFDYHIENINRLIYISSQGRHHSATYEMNMSNKIQYDTDPDSRNWENWEDKFNQIITILRQKGYALEISTYDVYEMRHLTIEIKW